VKPLPKILVLTLVGALLNPFCCCWGDLAVDAFADMGEADSSAGCCGGENAEVPVGNSQDRHTPDDCPHEGGKLFGKAELAQLKGATFSVGPVFRVLQEQEIPLVVPVCAGEEISGTPDVTGFTHGQGIYRVNCVLLR
jgi:hypothetical protein